MLALVRAAGYEPQVVEYLQAGWTRGQLLALFAAAGITPRQALRESKSPAAELGLLEPGINDEALLTQMVAHPVLVNRPLVATPRGVRLCRPSERVLDLIERMPPGPVSKEDGTPVVDAQGRRLG